jgi:ubiquinone/menaquinone biosynthesis C-methylase UbiE
MLDGDGRFGAAGPRGLLEDTGLRAGHTVVDMGCGPGLLTLAAASVVGAAGKVYAVDIKHKMLDLVSSTATTAGLGNVETVSSTGNEVPLPDHIAHYVICSQVLHYPDSIPERVDLARELARLVKPSGRILVIEWVPSEGDISVLRLAPADTEEILRRAGLRTDMTAPAGEKQYAIVASRRPPEPASPE